MYLLYLSRLDVEAAEVSMSEVIRVVEAVFVEKGNHRVEMPPKPGIHPLQDAFIHAMPAFLPNMGAAGLKWVSGFPQNLLRGLPYITGLLILNDPQTGIPFSVMDCTWITAMRTGAATAVAAKYLARSESRTLAICGCGVQGRSNLESLKIVFPKLARVQAYDVSPATADGFCRDAARRWGLDAVACANPREACREADIIVTAGPISKHPTPVIEREWLRDGAFLSPVDLDSYVKPEVFAAAAKYYTDDLEQQQYFKKVGYFANLREPDGDLGELLCGKKSGRAQENELIVVMNVGLAIEDIATAMVVYQQAKAKGLGVSLPL
jgi:ornithine cyclodeaminase/alanine dehydrogenase-like protein (mu-crystallin family)